MLSVLNLISAGWWIKLMSQLDKILIQNLLLGSLTSTVLKALRLTGNSC